MARLPSLSSGFLSESRLGETSPRCLPGIVRRALRKRSPSACVATRFVSQGRTLRHGSVRSHTGSRCERRVRHQRSPLGPELTTAHAPSGSTHPSPLVVCKGYTELDTARTRTHTRRSTRLDIMPHVRTECYSLIKCFHHPPPFGPKF